MSNRYPQFVFFIAVFFLGMNACKTEKDPCATAVAPAAPTSNLVFRVFDAVTHEDLYLTTNTAKKLNPDSFSASQPCSPYNPLVWETHTYDIPTKTGPAPKGFVFKFLNLRNPAVTEPYECSTINVHWSKNDSDIITWSTTTHQDGDCPSYQVLDAVYFNGIPVPSVWDSAYQYYRLYK